MEEMQEQLTALRFSLETEAAGRLAAEAGRLAAEAAREEEAAKRLAAEAAREAEAGGRLAAEEGRLAAEAARKEEAAKRLVAEAAREAEAAGRLAAEVALNAEAKRGFFDRMKAISSSSAADSSNSADVVRRGAPAAVEVPLEELLAGMPQGDAQVTAAAWEKFALSHASDWHEPTVKFKENLHMHPTIKRLLEPLLPPYLKLWCNAVTEDEERGAHIQPDFSVTHARDSLPSLIGAALLVEVKLPDNLQQACNQACCYMRRRIYRLSCECDARGEALPGISTYAVATDGKKLVILRMGTGAPLPGGSYATSVPCPVLMSPPLCLLEWDYKTLLSINARPPPAIPALLRLLASPLLLGPSSPLCSLTVRLTQDGDGNAYAPEVVTTLALSSRLGCGGTSDAYACTNDAADWLPSCKLVVKVARCSTQALVGSFAREVFALNALGHTSAAVSGSVPRLVSSGHRAKAEAQWPVLLLSPCGQPLTEWVRFKCKVADASSVCSAGALIKLREHCASTVAVRVLAALQIAHKLPCNLVHCDVRPSNIVVSEGERGEAMLIDWGHSRPLGDEAIGSGVVAYSDGRMYTNATSYLARPDGDLLSLIYTWFSVACSSACEAPWLSMHGLREDAQVLDARSKWLESHEGDSDSRVGRVAAAHKKLLGVIKERPRDYEEMYKIVSEALR